MVECGPRRNLRDGGGGGGGGGGGRGVARVSSASGSAAKIAVRRFRDSGRSDDSSAVARSSPHASLNDGSQAQGRGRQRRRRGAEDVGIPGVREVELARVKALNPSLEHGERRFRRWWRRAGSSTRPTRSAPRPTGAPRSSTGAARSTATRGRARGSRAPTGCRPTPTSPRRRTRSRSSARRSSASRCPRRQLAGSYKLDQGDGLADFSDLSHEVYAIDGPTGPPRARRAGRGDGLGRRRRDGNTEFGRFVSLGRLDGAATASDDRPATRASRSRAATSTTTTRGLA